MNELTWEKRMPMLIYVLEAGNYGARKTAKEELMRLAKAVDKIEEEAGEAL